MGLGCGLGKGDNEEKCKAVTRTTIVKMETGQSGLVGKTK